jgi:outer membrane receptor protein involved in Fe transport
MRKTWATLWTLTAALGAGAFAGQGAAFAQTPTAAPEGELAGEIVVTVQKREQAIIDVPMAVTSLNESFLERVNITKFDELALWVPGLEVQEQSPNNPAISLRGITTDSGEATQEARVAIFQDGVSISKSRGSYVELFDIERVEVAKGPQATLFGRGALIGGINIIQNKPDLNDLEISGGARFGDYEAFGLNGVVNVAILEDVLALRIAGTSRSRDGFNANVLGGEALGGVSLDAWRASLAWEPNPDFSATLILNTQKDDNSGTSFKSRAFDPPGGDNSPFTAAALNPSAPGFERDRPLGLDREVSSTTILADWAITDAYTLTSITGHRYFESFEVFDPDGSQNPILMAAEDSKGRQWSQEFRLNFDDGGPISWFVGASWFDEDGRQRVPTVWDERFTLGLVTGVLSRPNPQSSIPTPFLTAALQGVGVPASAAPLLAPRLKAQQYEVSANASETTAVDLYGDFTWAVTPELELSAGLRWTQDDKVSRIEAATVNGSSILGSILALSTLPPATQNAVITQIATTGTSPLPLGLFTQPTAPGGISRSETFDDFTWRLVARYAMSDDLSLWASYARGRRPEVISATAGNAPGSSARTAIVPAEEVDSIEIGLRGQTPDGALRYDGSVYYYEYSNFQTTAFQGLQIVTINAGSASTTGFEGSLFWRANDALELFGNYGYNRSRFDSGARNGNVFRLSPDHSFAIGASLSADLKGLGLVRFTPSYNWQSKVFFDDNNDKPNLQQALFPTLADTVVDEFQDDYGLLDLRLTLELEGGGFEVGAFVKNALDEEYVMDAGNTGDTLGLPTFIRGAPATFGLELKARY